MFRPKNNNLLMKLNKFIYIFKEAENCLFVFSTFVSSFESEKSCFSFLKDGIFYGSKDPSSATGRVVN